MHEHVNTARDKQLDLDMSMGSYSDLIANGRAGVTSEIHAPDATLWRVMSFTHAEGPVDPHWPGEGRHEVQVWSAPGGSWQLHHYVKCGCIASMERTHVLTVKRVLAGDTERLTI